MKRDYGCLLQPKNVAIYTTIIKRCVMTDRIIVT